MSKLWQIIVGAILCVLLGVALIYGPLPIFWEHEDQPYVYSITWRSGVVLALLILFTQWIAYLLFRWLGRHQRNR